MMAIADTEGVQAVTMRRLAAELGTMTLYHYVGSKTDLIALMEDAIMGELLVPDDQQPSDWRQALTAIASRTRDSFRRHPWALTGMRDTGLSPHALPHFEQSLAAVAVAGTGLDPAARLELIASVDDYVAGFVLKATWSPPWRPSHPTSPGRPPTTSTNSLPPATTRTPRRYSAPATAWLPWPAWPPPPATTNASSAGWHGCWTV
jgi:AcrR family transcriptional regulator